jgi:predicted DNA-binding antitoxin AbrB/MazE fold protein
LAASRGRALRLTALDRAAVRTRRRRDRVYPVRPIEARYVGGVLKPAEPLPLRAGERVGVVVTRVRDEKRWDLARLATGASEDADLARLGLDELAELELTTDEALGRVEPAERRDPEI